MDSSIFLAQAWGLYLVVVSSALLINRNNLRLIFHSYQNEETPFFSGFIVLAVGIVMILAHSVWTADWRGVLTVLGWVVFIKGLVRLIWPALVVSTTKQLKNSHALTGVLFFTLLLGVYLVLSSLTA